ncbi:iron-regulated protein [Synechococcales cyanobacterium C]|uniref:Iron-regulated protein n=1 Tax=Petrachloros mirabilis ULC683 TaxID=2781853 RepID=A0A8K2A139_9CYAN|nr:iron-regulated protein [Petrachloros mirabilis ULC683]
MNRLYLPKLTWILLGSGLLFMSAAFVTVHFSSAHPSAQKIDTQQLQPLLEADIIYLGERHDNPQDHALQLDILRALQAQNPNLAIAMEMFQRPFQPVIDQYLAGEISETDLVIHTEYEHRWGFPWEFYAPVLRFALAHNLPVLAVNAPSEAVRQVARHGLQGLAAEDFVHIPPLAEIDTSNPDYRAWVLTAFKAHSAPEAMDFDNFFAAQVLWDETMAQAIVEFRQAHPDTQVVVLAGQGHILYGYGIPDRVARRLGSSITQKTILLNPSDEITADDMADLLWYSPESSSRP